MKSAGIKFSFAAFVLTLAAFFLSVISAPLAVFAFDTKTACDSLLDGVVTSNNLNSATSSSSAMLMYYDPSGDLNIRVYNNPTVTSNNNNEPYYTSIGGYYYSGYYNDNGYNNGQGLGSGGFIVYSDKIVLVRNNGATVDMPFSATTGYYVAGYSVPETCSSDYAAQSAYRTLYEQANAPSNPVYKWSLYSPVNNGKTLGQTISSDYKTAVDKGLTTTTTTTHTTTTTTTTAPVTQPPFPYATDAPFTLPDSWTADYSETTPAPDIGDFELPTASYTSPDVPQEVMQGVGFWFTIFTDLWQSFNLTWVVLLVCSLGFIIYLLWGR